MDRQATRLPYNSAPCLFARVFVQKVRTALRSPPNQTFTDTLVVFQQSHFIYDVVSAYFDVVNADSQVRA
jgi:hypothetical protein